MLRILRLLFTGTWHQHKWGIIKETILWEKESDKLPIGTRYTLKCSECGKMKVFKGY